MRVKASARKSCDKETGAERTSSPATQSVEMRSDQFTAFKI
jgi:hypothetical protein